ncbi:alpha/beta fold hydrolase [Vitiosangium sp. GDMCC 1.1324]|uniref:alpha/beta fold hydrolase n=1 Tax=Vitiosangium sp. (strain GDMCC 1.1324) TaxID=2138576 RepID=UPI000D33469E|nr:alpha/beta hydrolase [Vitiosangium sp. GDMCC 1.1324]PTL80128.1 alpha/beta hydrolase [Vitiosangium sp. GDMCC 1.1324]
METRYTPSGVRMRRHSTRPGPLNWLLLPGGPGIGSESLQELADVMDVPGSIWLIDLPGHGSNIARQHDDPYAQWPQVLVEAAEAVSDAVFLGHSTGGMYLLATPQLKGLIRGMGLLDTAPDSSWHPKYVAMTQQYPLPAFECAALAYAQEKTIANLTALAVTSAEWNFTPPALEAGRALLARMPYNIDAVEWSDAHFDHTYTAQWWPTDIPVLRLWGECDRIVSQHGWAASAYHTPNVLARSIPQAGHFPWIDHPVAVTAAFVEFTRRLLS